MGLSGTLTVGGGEAVVRTARWIPRFLGGAVTIRQHGGVVQLNKALIGGKFFITDGTRTAVRASRPGHTEDLAKCLRAQGFEVSRQRSRLSSEMDFGISRPGRNREPDSKL